MTDAELIDWVVSMEEAYESDPDTCSDAEVIQVDWFDDIAF